MQCSSSSKQSPLSRSRWRNGFKIPPAQDYGKNRIPETTPSTVAAARPAIGLKQGSARGTVQMTRGEQIYSVIGASWHINNWNREHPVSNAFAVASAQSINASQKSDRSWLESGQGHRFERSSGPRMRVWSVWTAAGVESVHIEACLGSHDGLLWYGGGGSVTRFPVQ